MTVDIYSDSSFSGLTGESSLLFWIPAFAGMTFYGITYKYV